jgi:glycosyltransferase involved in cell wall biosynthesis
MKVLLINDYAVPGGGGAEIVMLSLRDGLRRLGHDARLFSTSAQQGEGENRADYRCFGTVSRFRTMLQSANPWAYFRLKKVLRNFQPDVVHVGTFLTQLSPLILPLLTKYPSLHLANWYRPICPVGNKMLPGGTVCEVSPGTACYNNGCLPFRDWVPLMFQMKLWQRWRYVFDKIATDSNSMKQKLEAAGMGSVFTIWNGVPVRPERGPLADPPTVAFAGRLVREKGTAVLIRAFSKVLAEIPEAKLLLVGDGPERKSLSKLISNLGLSSATSITSYLPRQELERYFDRAWVQVVPSVWAEPFGLVVLDSMMRGTAVVASSSGGIVETVRHGSSGLLVPPGNTDALANALIRILKDRPLAEQMGRAGREIALENFSEDIFIGKYVRLYEELVHNYKR